jgi:hypothetical protein
MRGEVDEEENNIFSILFSIGDDKVLIRTNNYV